MKLLVRFLLLLAVCGSHAYPEARAQAVAAHFVGEWTGTALVHGQQVPVHLRLSGSADALYGVLINGSENSAASSASLSGQKLLLTFNDYARTLDATLGLDGKLTGSFGTVTVRYPLTLERSRPVSNRSIAQAAGLTGDWEIAVHSAKGELAWQLHIDPVAENADHANVKAVIQRIDGDTGSLFGRCAGNECLVSHFSAAGPALYRLHLQSNSSQSLLVSNLLRADADSDTQQNLIARRPEAARAAQLPEPTDPTQQTTMKDPSARFAFRAVDLSGHTVANTDPRFDGEVVIVSVGGSWCPNCHDEAPLLESLYKQFHARGLEIVNLSFEEEDQLKDPTRLRGFIARYHLDYTILLAGTTEQLNEKIPQAEHLNCWPTSFFLGRDGRVRRIHAGFAGPANPPAHDALVREMTDLIIQLLEEPVPSQSAASKANPRPVR